MYIAYASAFLITILSLTLSWVNEYGYKEVLVRDTVNPSAFTFKDKTKDSFIVQSNYNNNEAAVENIELSLIRVCRLVEIQAHGAGCPSNDPAVAWQFVGSLGTKGSLIPSLSGSVSSSFSCSASGRVSYSKYLLRRTIVLQEVIDRKIGYDLRGISNLDRRHDPCGYIGIVSGT